MKWTICFSLLICFLFNSSVFAGQTSSLSTNYTKLSVNNLPIGEKISMKAIADAPMKIGNRSETDMFVTITIKTPEKIKEGYEAIPDSRWIKTEAQAVTITAKSIQELDVQVFIPDDETHLGKKYQANIELFGINPHKKGLAFGIQYTGYFLFSVAPVRNEEGLERALKNPASAEFDIIPPRVNLYDIKAGQKVKLRTHDKKPIILKNRSNKKQRYYLAAVDPSNTTVTPDRGSQVNHNVDNITVKKDEVQLSSGQQKDINIELRVPKEIDFSQGPLFYLVSVSNGLRQGVNKYIHIYLYPFSKREPFKDEAVKK